VTQPELPELPEHEPPESELPPSELPEIADEPADEELASFQDAPIESASVELLRKFTEGDEESLGLLIEKEGARLLPYIRRRLPSHLRRRVGASDILQNTVIDLLAVRERFEDRGVPSFRKMLKVMADLNIARAMEREHAQKRDIAKDKGPVTLAGGRRSRDGLQRLPGDTPTASEDFRRREDKQRLGDLLLQLPEEHQEIIRLVHEERLPHAEVASRLGISEAAARKRLSRAMSRLRQQMGG